MKTAEHQILTRIGFAERWLQRAREECLDGEVARGLLTLVLADAEVRRVLQLAVPPAPRSRPRLAPALAVGAGLLIAAALALQLGVLALGAAPVDLAGLVPGLTLRPGTGVLREPVEAGVPQEPALIVAAPTVQEPAQRPAQPVIARRSQVARSTPPLSPVVSQQVVVPVVPATPAPSLAPVAAPSPAPAAVPAVVAAPAPTAVLSGIDLLDLVIVADRTLRRSQP